MDGAALQVSWQLPLGWEPVNPQGKMSKVLSLCGLRITVLL